MNKKYILVLLFLLLSIMTSAQQSFDVTGQVKDDNTGQNLEFCSVVVINNENRIIKGGITNEKGFFNIPIESGTYKLAISFVGFENDTINVGLISKDKYLGVFKLKSNIESIKGVSIKGNSNIATIDKDIKVVTAEMRKGSVDTKEILEKINGVSYDRYANSIKVDNNKNVIILVDGVEKSQEYIKNLDPKRLNRVEIVRDPGGRYGLEGYAAVINVILNKNYRGTEVFFYDQAIVDRNPNQQDLLLPINNLYMSLNQTVNNFNFYTTVSHNYMNFGIPNNTITEFENGRTISQTPFGEEDNAFETNKNMNYTFGADYYINPKHSVSFETSIKNFPKANAAGDATFQTLEILNSDTLNLYTLKSNSNSNSVNTYSTLFYRGKLSNRSNLKADFSYSNSNQEYENNIEQESLYLQRDIGNTKSDYTKFNVELDHNLTDKMSFQFGYSNVWKQSKKDYNISLEALGTGTSNSDDYKYNSNEIRNMIYGYYSYRMNNKLSMQVGLAAEHSQLNVQGNKNNYMIYQPFFTMMYKAHPMLSFKLKYRSNSDYPTSSQTDSTLVRIDPYNIAQGNPDLSPTVVHKMSLRIQALQGLISLEPYYHFSNNYIGQIGKVLNDSTFGYTYRNVGFYQHTGVNLNITIPIGKRFVIQNGFDFYSSKIDLGEYGVNRVNDWSADIKAIMLEKGNMPMFILMYQRENTKNINSMGYYRGENDYWMVYIQKELMKKKLSLAFGFMLPVDFGVNYEQDTYAAVNGYQSTTTNDIRVLKKLLILKLTYRFNKGKIVRKTEKDIEKDIEDYSGKSLM
ncbi:MAG: TonB-dependent receptor [Bacteroidales bacterium]|nr:TonB-dependent receptor [Bacteroidales bacterium]